ncbi:MAG: hypothetical protein HY430_03650 [Candidatus Levybacteria bacterium]|nr:hypothetical protein [Candidatus Levybacteria bacterium]
MELYAGLERGGSASSQREIVIILGPDLLPGGHLPIPDEVEVFHGEDDGQKQPVEEATMPVIERTPVGPNLGARRRTIAARQERARMGAITEKDEESTDDELKLGWRSQDNGLRGLGKDKRRKIARDGKA